ncbi:phage portal protein [Enterococcus sp.]|uniref:phage portal protein n=1 Tax=Enterococcus sp. TaxID=35783 RepID=UPI0028995367|nr:phage portal protein [Enterococcus sp.]
MNTIDNLNEQIILDYKSALPQYTVMDRYYRGDHDCIYFANDGNRNNVAIHNFIAKFCDEEVNYCLNNPISYVSKTGDPEIIKAIDKYLTHWKTNHNSILMRNLEIYGKCYNLHYIDAKGRFCERLLTPLNAIAYRDHDGIPQRFIHFYTLKYDTSEYYDIYYPDGRIETYKGNGLWNTQKQPFKGVPVSICEMDDISETVFSKIRTLQDSYNQVLSDQVAIIESYKNAYLIMTGVSIDSEMTEKLKTQGLIVLPSNGKASWLMKEMNDGYITSMLTTLRDSMYSATNHIDGNEKLVSNASSLALRTRLIFLEQRSKAMYDYVSDAIYDRLERLFEYLYLKGVGDYDVANLEVKFTPSVPVDTVSVVQTISQLGDKLSTETALSLLPFIENPAIEIEKIKKERADLEEVDLDKLPQVSNG